MRRLLQVLLLLGLGLGLVTLGMDYVLRGAVTPPAVVSLRGLTAPVAVSELPGHVLRLNAQSASDAWVAVGYVHGRWHAWPLLLWRQAALGQQAEWFGLSVLPFDSLIHTLRLPTTAKQAFEALPEPTRRILEAYSIGLNAALQEQTVHLRDELVLLNLPIEPWQPWHSLALERLLALLALPDSIDTALPLLAPLRAWLHLYGFRHSVAWIHTGPNQQPVFFQRHVYGNLALPFFQEVLLNYENSSIWLVTIPGTLLFPAGQTERQAWCLFLTSHRARTEQHPRASLPLQPVYERLRLPSGDERLLHMEQAAAYLVLREPVPDTVRVLWWPGLQPISDLSAWLALLTDQTASFQLFDGTGLRIEANGQSQVLGTPSVVEPIPGGLLVGQTFWHRYLARRLRELPLSPDPPSEDHHSLWATERLHLLLTLLDTLHTSDTLIQEAYAFLRNWDGTYDRMSIGATIFETWLAHYQSRYDSLPPFSFPDISLRVQLKQALHFALQDAVATLRKSLGNDPNRWRWEHAHPLRLMFPVWAYRTNLPAAHRYAPFLLPGEGHPSTLRWNPSPLLNDRPAPAHWEGWIYSPPGKRFYVRRWWPQLDRFLERYRTLKRELETFSLDPTNTPLRQFTLRPKR
jgi:hypothetical protein